MNVGNSGFNMKTFIYIVLCFFLMSACTWKDKCCTWKDKWVKEQVEKEEGSKKTYLMGYKMGEGTKRVFKTEEERKIFLTGVYHSIKDKDPLVTMESKKAQKSQPDKAQPDKAQQDKAQPAKEDQKPGESNMDAGKKFLEENKNKPGVKETASGLQYKVLKEGSGKSPSAEDSVEVHYRGTLIDGTEFDSSYKRNETINFPLNGVIKGWTEGLQLMKEGAKYEFYIPFNLAYGPAGTRGIPPYSTLIFEVELIKVK